MFSYKSKYFLQFLPIKNFLNKKVNAHQMQEKTTSHFHLLFCLWKNTYILVRIFITCLFVFFFTYVICYLQIVNMKKEKKIFETVYFSRLLCIKLNPKKNQAAQKFTDHILVLSHWANFIQFFPLELTYLYINANLFHNFIIHRCSSLNGSFFSTKVLER